MTPKKKFGPKIFLAAFVLLCFTWLLWFFVGGTGGIDSENRELTAKPQLTLDTYEAFPARYDAYYNDTLPFRSDLIALNSAIDYFVFRRASNSSVIIGKGEWLFYGAPGDGASIACYQGTNLFSEEQLEQILHNCRQVQSQLAAQGKEFVLFIAPNKERIYPEYMPDFYGPPADDYRALQVVTYLRAHSDICVVYPYEQLMQAKELLAEPLYYKTDTHWNQIGAYVGSAALLRELGGSLPDLTAGEVSITAKEPMAGDLAGMLNLKKQLSHVDCQYAVEGYDQSEVALLEQDFATVIRYEAPGRDPRRVYVYRDSFATNMAPYLGSQFAETYLRHKNTYTYEDFVAQDPDIFLYETVERYVEGLLTFSLNGPAA